MELHEFTKKVTQAMELVVEKEFGEDYHVEVREVCKNNGVTLQGLLISSRKGNVAPTIYLDSFWDAYEEGMTFAEIIRRLLAIYKKELCGRSVDLEFFRKFDEVKDRICYRLVGKDANAAILKDIPHIDYLDLVVCFFYAYRGEELGEGSILIRNSHMEMWQTNLLELMDLAKENTPRLFPGQIFSMQEVIAELSEENSQLTNDVPCDLPMRVLSNASKNQGAACILYDEFLDRAAEEFGKNLFVLPSSIHEVILLPDTGKESPEELRKMIHEVNTTQVAPEEVLSDSLYYYDSERKKLAVV